MRLESKQGHILRLLKSMYLFKVFDSILEAIESHLKTSVVDVCFMLGVP